MKQKDIKFVRIFVGRIIKPSKNDSYHNIEMFCGMEETL